MPDAPREIVTLPLEHLYLDTANPRFASVGNSQEVAIQQLFDSSKILELATEILKLGYFDNEQPIVLVQNGKHIVLEGNRRVCCLKALNNTQLAPALYREKMEQLVNRYATEAASLPTKIRVLLVSTRADASPHIARLHTKTPKEKWTTDQQANFYYNLHLEGTPIHQLLSNNKSRVTQLLKMATMRKLIGNIEFEDSTLHDYAAGSALQMSRLEYAYKIPEVQELIGIEFTDYGFVRLRGQSDTQPDPENVAKQLSELHIDRFARLIRAFKEKSLNTRSPELKKGTKEYFDFLDLIKGTQPAATWPESDEQSFGDNDDTAPGFSPSPTGENPSSDSTTNNEGAIEEEQPTPTPKPNRTDTLKKLPFQGVDFKKLPVNLQDRYRELASLNVEIFPITAACFLRSVLETQIKAVSRRYLEEQIQKEKNHILDMERKYESDIKQLEESLGKEATHTNIRQQLAEQHEDYKKASSRVETLKLLLRSGQLDKYFMICCYERYRDIKSLRSSLERIKSGNAQTSGSISWFNMALHNHEFTATKNDIHAAWRLVSPILRHLIDSNY